MAQEGSRDFSAVSELWFSLRPVLLIILLIGFSLYTNEAIIQYRMDEYNRTMETLSQSYNSSHALNMLARFDLIKKRQNMPEEDETALELKLQSLASGNLLGAEVKESSIKSKVLGMVINAVGFILGKQKTKADVPNLVMRDLEVAYFYERSRKYDKAIEIYTKGLSDPHLTTGVTATLLLHRGFCSSLMGEYQKAIADFKQVAEIDPETEESMVAGKLSAMTLALADQVRLAKEANQSPYQAGKQFFLLANYAEAAKSLQKVIATSKDSVERMQSRYLYGRSQEELGQDSDAVLTYRQVIQQAPASEEAKKANRRLYVLGKYYSHDEDLAKTAMKKIEQYQDFKFINSLKSLDVPKPREQRPAAVTTPEAGDAGDKTAATKIEKLEHVDVADLKGDEKAKKENAAREQQKEAEKIAANINRNSQQARRSNAKIIADPMRQEAIFQTITNNQGELEFIFQKWLRKGNEAFDGTLTIRMIIDPTGVVKDAKIVNEKSTIDNAPFNAEILQTVKRWKFRADPHANGDVPVSFPVTFVNKQ